MLSKKTWAVMLTAAVVLMMSGCATEVKRLGIEEVKDLSGNWNDTDSRLVSDEMIKDSLSGAWIDRHEQKNNNKAPAVIVGNIRNLSHEHINTRAFIADLERAYVNSGRIDVVASKVERDGIREERADMDLNASEDSRKEMGKETGADYMLIGTINSIIDASGGEQIRFYQVDLTLVNILDNRKVWTGQKKLKKDVKEAKFR